MNAFFVIFISLAIRAAISSWDYSGKGKPPIFGDFEAQRHWLEITTALPIGQWYIQSKQNDLQYWGLDYPPLTAYTSWLFGMLAQGFCPDLVEFYKSRGYEGDDGKFFMRMSVLISDFLIFFPSIILSLKLLLTKSESNSRINHSMFWCHLLACFLCPSSVLIDHGHFQYNGVCIGLALLGAHAVSCNRDVLGSFFFCLSLNFKQMSLYYAPVFFFGLLRKCIEKGSISNALVHLIKIGITVIATFVILWLPFCLFPVEGQTCASSLLHVLSRQFPFSRGIFEDKVANIWYAVSVVTDIRQFLSIPQLATASLAMTLVLLAPVAIDLLRKPFSPQRFVLALVNSSLAFFLASFQVHEKSLLLPLVPSLLILNQAPMVVTWFQVLGTFTMFPLLVRDGLRIPYFAMNIAFVAIAVLLVEAAERNSKMFLNSNAAKEKTTALAVENNSWNRNQVFEIAKRLFIAVSAIGLHYPHPTHPNFQCILIIFFRIIVIGMILLHILEATWKPPDRYPDLYPALFSLFGAANLIITFLYMTSWQLTLTDYNDVYTAKKSN